MSRFPDLLDEQRRALFDIVEILRKHNLEGKAIALGVSFGVTGRIGLDLGGPSRKCLDSDFSTLRVLDEAGYVSLTEAPIEWSDGSMSFYPTLTLKKLGADYYDWCHNPPWYKPVAEIWFALAPDTRSAIVGAVTTFLLGALALLIRGCLSG